MAELVIMPKEDYQNICNSVRSKTGGTALLKSGEVAEQIMSISAGGGGGSTASVPWNDVTFIDYDGTVLHSYTLEEAQALTELPPLPEQPGLICQGWNWSLEDIKAQGKVIVGAMYITDDGKTRIYITLHEGRTSPMLGVCPNGTVTVDWGDGTEPDVLTGNNTTVVKWTPTHEYAKPGDYVISMIVDGTMWFYGTTNNSYTLTHSQSTDNRNKAYSSSVNKIEIGDGVTGIYNYAFQNCYNLTSVVIPNSVTIMYKTAFCNCYSLTSVATPGSVSESVFQNCYNLTSVVIPIKAKSIGTNAFRSCRTLASVVIPNSVTSIGGSAFYNCHGVRYYDFSACTSVPTLEGTSAFTGIAADCQILIPSALYDEWSTATNWATYASYMVAV